MCIACFHEILKTAKLCILLTNINASFSHLFVAKICQGSSATQLYSYLEQEGVMCET